MILSKHNEAFRYSQNERFREQCDLVLNSSLSLEEIERNFEGIDFFKVLIESLKEASAHAKGASLYSIRFNMDEVQREKRHTPTDTQWFSFTGADPATPSFCTFGKSYFGSGEMINAFSKKRNGDRFGLVPCELIHSQRLIFGEIQWDYINVWDCAYHMRADSAMVDQVLLRDNDRYYLCICPVFYGLEVYSDIRNEWKGVRDRFWGMEGLIERIGNEHRYTLYVCQQAFQSLDDATKTMDDPSLICFDAVCDEIFGDG